MKYRFHPEAEVELNEAGVSFRKLSLFFAREDIVTAHL